MDAASTSRSPIRLAGIVVPLLLAVLLAAAAYCAAVAVGLLEVGPLPGDMPSGEVLIPLALWALFLGGLALLAAATVRPAAEALATPLLPLLPLAAASYAVAYYCSYDGYYAPPLVRVATASDVEWGWIALLAVGGVAAAFLARRPVRQAVAVQGIYLLAAAVAVFLVGPFH
jgi:hypothetical protein